jgi:hypothetical protein
LFCQNGVEATVCVFLPLGTLARDVSVELVDDRRFRVGVKSTAGTAWLLDRRLAYDVKRAAPRRRYDADEEQPEDDEPDVDWELLMFADDRDAAGGTKRIARCTFRKNPPQGLQMWWRRAFEGDADEVDLGAIKERRGMVADPRGAASLQDVWRQAHEQFRHSVAHDPKWKPVTVDVPSDDDD